MWDGHLRYLATLFGAEKRCWPFLALVCMCWGSWQGQGHLGLGVAAFPDCPEDVGFRAQVVTSLARLVSASFFCGLLFLFLLPGMVPGTLCASQAVLLPLAFLVLAFFLLGSHT